MPSTPRTRKRLLPGPAVTSKRWSTFTYSPTTERDVTQLRRGTDGRQVTVSEGHPWPPPKNKTAVTDVGGPFTTTKSYLVVPAKMPYAKLGPWRTGPFTDLINGQYVNYYRDLFIAGNFVASPGQVTIPTDFQSVMPPDLSSSDAVLDQYGATAISRCEPTQSVADLSTALLELMKEGLPSLVGSQTWRNRADSVRKNAGSEYLNVQFGWLPLVDEVTKVAKAIKKSDEIIAQYERDAGRVVRRKYYFPSEVERSTQDVNCPYPVWNAGSFPELRVAPYLGKTYRTRETVRRRWFSGAFTYFLPSGYDSRNRVSELAFKADKLFGLSITPEVLWNVTPWSWATDWFANTGDVIHNLEAFKSQGLIMRYGYIMEHTMTTDTYSFVYDAASTANRPRVANLVLVTETKKRRPANPFGFGVKWTDLSSFQLSIAAALGLTKSRR